MTNALARVVNFKQMENENVLDYVKRFKQLRDVATNQLGREFFTSLWRCKVSIDSSLTLNPNSSQRTTLLSAGWHTY